MEERESKRYIFVGRKDWSHLPEVLQDVRRNPRMFEQ
jgi:hypothetical protein